MSEMSDIKTTHGENGEKWRWRICLFHLFFIKNFSKFTEQQFIERNKINAH